MDSSTMSLNERVTSLLKLDERIIKEYKANKTRGLYLHYVASLIYLFIGVLLLVFTILIGIHVLNIYDGKRIVNFAYIPFLVLGVAFFIGGIIRTIIYKLRFNKFLFVITNQRIICGHGLIGQEFSFIEFKDINGIEVNLNFLDKMLNSATGNIIFLRIGTPTGYESKANTNYPFIFRYINDPYNVFKEIENIIDESKIVIKEITEEITEELILPKKKNSTRKKKEED